MSTSDYFVPTFFKFITADLEFTDPFNVTASNRYGSHKILRFKRSRPSPIKKKRSKAWTRNRKIRLAEDLHRQGLRRHSPPRNVPQHPTGLVKQGSPNPSWNAPSHPFGKVKQGSQLHPSWNATQCSPFDTVYQQSLSSGIDMSAPIFANKLTRNPYTNAANYQGSQLCPLPSLDHTKPPWDAPSISCTPVSLTSRGAQCQTCNSHIMPHALRENLRQPGFVSTPLQFSKNLSNSPPANKPVQSPENRPKRKTSYPEESSWIEGISKSLHATVSDSRLSRHSLSHLSVSRKCSPGSRTSTQASAHHSPKGLSLISFTLRESVGMYRGAAPPLDCVIRGLSSEFWLMEFDTWADLLIICHWANPTYCEKCSKETMAVTTSCNHIVCRSCTLEWLKDHDTCPDCGKEVGMLVMGTINQLSTKRVSQDKEVPCSKQICTNVTDQQEKAVQYSVLVKFRERLAECLSNEPTTIARDLFSTGFITERVLHKTNELNEIKADKADRLCSSVLDVIKKSPRELDEFLSVLQRPARQKLYEELVQDLKSALNQ